MNWILIIWMAAIHSNQSLALNSVEFNSESACRSAFVEMVKVNGGDKTIRGVCVKKD